LRIRSRSSRNELIKKEIRQKCPAMPGIFCDRIAAQVIAREIPNGPVVLLAAALPHMKQSVHSLKPFAFAAKLASAFGFRVAMRDAGYPEKESRKASLR
jgi:hypothetical protein